MRTYQTISQIKESLKSDVEKNKKHVKIGDKLMYIDEYNYMTFEVIDIYNSGVELKPLNENAILSNTNNLIDGTMDVDFSSMQIGWTFAKKTIENNKLIHKTQYNLR